MKKIVQSLKTKKTELVDVPVPAMKPGHLLIKTTCSLVSTGTERMAVESGKLGLMERIMQRPGQVKQVIDKLKNDGIGSTIDVIQDKLDQVIPLGYCNVGIVIESEVDELDVGDRVVSNGPHAEIVRVPEKLEFRT